MEETILLGFQKVEEKGCVCVSEYDLRGWDGLSCFTDCGGGVESSPVQNFHCFSTFFFQITTSPPPSLIFFGRVSKEVVIKGSDERPMIILNANLGEIFIPSYICIIVRS